MQGHCIHSHSRHVCDWLQPLSVEEKKKKEKKNMLSRSKHNPKRNVVRNTVPN